MTNALRYVVLHHVGMSTLHFDLLFEWAAGETLTSFRCPAWPPIVGDRFEERPDHRAIYLTREGPLSGGRGSVTRIASGTIVHEILASDPPTLALTFDDEWPLVLANTIENGPAAFTTWTVISTR